MFSLCLVALISTAHLSFATPQGPQHVTHGMFPGTVSKGTNSHWRRGPISRRQTPVGRRQAADHSSCGSGSQLSTQAPKTNIFAGLSNDEHAAVTSFLHDQTSLNLTAAATATPWDNKVLQIDLLQPNKSDALSYLDGGSATPSRYARALLRFGTTEEPYVQEYQVGPLPISNGTSTVAELNYIYNKGRGRQRVYDLDQEAIAAFTYTIGTKLADLTQPLLGGAALGNPNDSFAIAGTVPLLHEDEKIFQWNQFYALHTGPCYDEDLLPTGLLFKSDITGRDPTKWSVAGWQYNGVFYETEDAFRAAVSASNFVKPGLNVDGQWACTDYNGDSFPHDELNPPVPVQPDGPRFALDEKERYVEWMGFSFYLGFTRDRGLDLHNIKYNGERIIYELGFQEALAHYAAASDPFQASNAYLDSEFGMGQTSWQLVSGFDCPAYATYLNSSYYAGETTHVHPSNICMFEFDTNHPIQRHTTPIYVSVTKNIAFILRTSSTVGNYDYLFDYEFYLDGSIHVTVRASGYIQSSFWSTDAPPEDGFHIHDHLIGSMHEHVINYKVDFDVAGTANSLHRSALVPVTETYDWSNGRALNTMKFDRRFITSEDEGKLNWDYNNAVMYSIVNKDAKNAFGEYRGFKILPATGNRNHLVIQNSTTLYNSVNWATHHLYALQRKDSEPVSAYPYNGWDPKDPVVDFAKFFDGESLDQQDIVIYFNLGMHHVPDTSDLPNTVMTAAHSSMVISPQNFNTGDESRRTIHGVRINAVNGSVTDSVTFGAKSPTCSLDLSVTAPNIQTWVGEVYTPKYPYHPDAQQIGNPGDGSAQGIRKRK